LLSRTRWPVVFVTPATLLRRHCDAVTHASPVEVLSIDRLDIGPQIEGGPAEMPLPSQGHQTLQLAEGAGVVARPEASGAIRSRALADCGDPAEYGEWSAAGRMVYAARSDPVRSALSVPG
jgi:hypothetical protein